MPSSLRIFNLNLNHGKLLEEKILPCLAKIKPDVFLAQEVFKNQIDSISKCLDNCEVFFSPLCKLSLDGEKTPPEEWGIAIFSKLELRDLQEVYYKGSKLMVEDNLTNSPANCRSIIQAKVQKGNSVFTVATTHFTWSAHGLITEEQLKDFEAFKKILNNSKNLILGGDFNTTRGKKIFDSLANLYKDNIPQKVKTTIDITVRPEVTKELVVDGLFTSPQYKCEKIELVNSLSDHLGIQATILKI